MGEPVVEETAPGFDDGVRRPGPCGQMGRITGESLVHPGGLKRCRHSVPFGSGPGPAAAEDGGRLNYGRGPGNPQLRCARIFPKILRGSRRSRP
ncbi:hypothetical protein GCM10012280_36630 [Wenjunlia tyrosinilytica]|uniref:Uncharacterized protein n=1 Tax=Wenjunlia tyrosinilytica TaxID=1544741 RepID=A0A918DZ84_9ACTN|nr:hypothetical protein GCM10012280_36630 [Wenjunlia tyrosinilytica]